jgi:asparagine synthase (glutamine-hydrolysing)
VEKLPPGNVLAVENGEPFVRAFWKLPDLRQTTARAQTFDEAVESLAERLRTAVKKRLTADVPIGLWLSGGLDSSLTAATWAAERPAGDEIPAFTAAFDWAEFDERDKAAACASRLGFAHQILNATPDGWTHLSDVIGGAGEPFFDSSALPTWLLAKETRRRVVVVLSGDGGDENFGGYERYLGMRLLSRWRAMPNLLRRSTRFLAEKLWGARRHGYGRAAAWLERCAEAMDGLADPDDALGAAYAEALSLFSEAQKRELYHPEFASEISGLDGRESFLAVWRTTRSGAESGQNRLARLMAADLRFYLPDDVLLKVDRMSMAHGLEVRSPFLDVDLAGWAAGLSDRIRLPAYKTKPMLRRLAQKKGLPGSVWRARKAGFGVPLDAWFRGPWKKKARALFQENLLSKEYVLRENAWKKLWDQHQEGKANHGERLYALVALDLWLRKFLKNGSSALVR